MKEDLKPDPMLDEKFESYRFLAWQALNCGYVGDQHRYDESYRPNGALERTEGVVKPRPLSGDAARGLHPDNGISRWETLRTTSSCWLANLTYDY